MSLITGDTTEPDVPDASPESFAPPPEAVRREMLRLQIEADTAEAVAEVVARKSEVIVEKGIHLSELDGETAADVRPLPPDPDAAGKGPTPG